MASPSRKSYRSPPSDPLELAEDALERLRKADDWDEPTKPQIMINIPAAALPPAEDRLPAPPRVPQALASSRSPSGTGGVVVAVWRHLPPKAAAGVAVVAIIAYTVLALAQRLPAWALP